MGATPVKRHDFSITIDCDAPYEPCRRCGAEDWNAVITFSHSVKGIGFTACDKCCHVQAITIPKKTLLIYPPEGLTRRDN